MFFSHSDLVANKSEAQLSQALVSSNLQNKSHYRFQSYSSNTNNLDALLHGLSYSKRWVYHFCQNLRIKCNYNNVLQVRLNPNTHTETWVEKVLSAGQCSAIIIEKNTLSPSTIDKLKFKCEQAGVLLLLLECHSGTLN